MKILVAIASHGTRNDEYLARLIQEYRSMSYSVDIVVLSNITKPVPEGVELLVGLPTKDPWSLPFGHKKLFADRIEKYDLFIYSEDDTLISEKNIASFLRATEVLPLDEIAGYLRVERAKSGEVTLADVHAHFHWDPRSVRVRGEYTFAFFTCEHSACYVLTREQLKRCIASGNFLVGLHIDKYDLLCSAATDPYTQCGFKKFVCISHLDDFLLPHLPNKYVGTRFDVEETEFRRQLKVLASISANGSLATSLFNAETKLREAEYSKGYYEPFRPELDKMIPANVKTVLSIGCGWGATELELIKRGLQVTAVGLDPVIPGEEIRQKAEVIVGDMSAALNQLEGRKFDCLLLLNVLHLVPDPVALISSLRKLLSNDSVVVALVPNMQQMSARMRRPKPYSEFGKASQYEKFLVHYSSHRTVRQWFRRGGMKVRKTFDVLHPRAQKIARLTLGTINPLLSAEFFAIASPD
jgi:2-polyprenyl-3-methyl-5-hydroxy-6-metoxy-1,4-benzoquinol methylase